MTDYIVLLLALLLFSQQSEACGISTHIEIAHRALEYFNHTGGKVNYRELLQKHPDAFQAGSVYPDAFYQDLCMQGRYHDVSEDSHWTPFLKTSVNYIRRTYPLPWNEGAQKLVAFVFGIASHMVADVSWHSLGIDQGFLRAMGKIDFHGSYSEAHQTGDFGGDVLSQFELDFHYLESKWYIPVKDLVNIYKELYNGTVIEESTIIDCTYILFLQLYGEYFAVSMLYSSYASKSPFLLERFNEYFLGGVDDMAFWSTNIFHLTSFMLENGTSDCYMPENPIFIQCNAQTRGINVQGKIRLQNSGYYRDFNSSIMRSVGAEMISSESGVYFQMNQWAERSMLLIANATRAVDMSKMFKVQYANHISTPSATYFVSSAYSRLGWSIITADLNHDGWDDLVVGAPGSSTLGHVQTGCVYIVYSNDSGLPSVNMDLDSDADVLLRGFEPSGRFGSSLAVLDFNADGQLDLAVGASSTGSSQLTYTGSVYVYYGAKGKDFSSEPNVIIKCRSPLECSFPTMVNALPYHALPVVDSSRNRLFYSDEIKTTLIIRWWPNSLLCDLVVLEQVYNDYSKGMITYPNQQTYCNLGWTLLAADVNGDKSKDLVIGSPYAPGGGIQRGLVVAFYSSHKRPTKGTLVVEEAEWSITGEHDYAWFGYSLHSHTHKAKSLLLIGSPTWSTCKMHGCKESQSTGKVYGINPPSKNITFIIEGHADQGKMGSSFASGRIAVKGERKQVLLIGAPTQSTVSKFVFLSRTLEHAGTATVYELKRKTEPSPISTLRGDRSFSRFGTKLHLSDLDDDGLDEIIVSSPLRTDDITPMLFGPQTGRVYIYNGNTTSTGLLSERCKSWFSPCPADWAQYVLISPEEKARFGSAVTTVKSKQKKQVVVAAVRSSMKARLAGSIYIYNLE